MTKPNFKDVPKKYRPIPFWSWNENLDTEETSAQVRMMADAGIGGFFMHARGGLQTEYLGEEWFENIEAATKTAEETGMYPWAYDENGWPSGFGAGVINGMGVAYQQKYLRMEDSLEHKETHIAKSGEHYFYYDINPFYVDTLDKEVIREFISTAYEPYYEKFGNRISGFFTDEPQISRKGIPWSFVFEEEYKKRYSQNILEHLEELYLPVGDYNQTRVNFWKMVTDLFSEAFMKQIYDWCNERNLKFTGHLLSEESILAQITTNGACMPHYEYLTIPGMDWLFRPIRECLTPLQVSSVAQQLDKEAVLSETFALCGHNVSFAELKGIYEWQMVRGINLLCQHLEGYSIRGIRKRDYPPAMYCQQPWWSEYRKFNDLASREGMILATGKVKPDVLVLHPQTTAWAMYDTKNREPIEELNQKFLALIKSLEEKHIPFHLGDETIIERHAKVENGKIIIGSQAYSKVITDYCEVLLPATEKILAEYKVQGGIIASPDDLEANNVTDEPTITYTVRYADNYTAHFFVNTSPDRKVANINVQGKRLDCYSGEMHEFDGVHEFEPWGSLMIIEEGSVNTKYIPSEKNIVKLSGSFEIQGEVENAITLDKCDYYFDGELQEKNGYVLNICERANALERLVKIHQDYHVNIIDIPSSLDLVCETPDIFKISVNGAEIEKNVNGYFVDKSFKRINIAKYVKQGENIISFDCDFVQSEQFYKDRRNSFIFESEKNKLAYDMEIEAIYLVGNFSVNTPGKWTALVKRDFRYSGDFEIVAPKNTVSLKHLEQNGFPFFCGALQVVGEIDITDGNSVLELDTHGINAVKIKIGDFEATLLTDTKFSIPDSIARGTHKIEITLINNLHNLLGPHHSKAGELTSVGPNSFFKEKCLWCSNPSNWDDDYVFVETSI